MTSFPALSVIFASALFASSAAVCFADDDAVTWTPVEVRSAVAASGTDLRIEADGMLLLTGDVPEQDTHVLTLFSPLSTITAISIEALPHGSLPMKGPGCHPKNGNFVLSEITMKAANKFTEKCKPVSLVSASTDFSQNGWGVHGAIDGNPYTGWAIHPRVGQKSRSVFELSKPVSFSGGANIQLELSFNHGSRHVLGHYRVTCTDQGSPSIERSDATPWGDVQKRINTAIDKGCANLLKRQGLDGSFPGHAGSYPTGETALVLYTLIKSGVPKSNPTVQRAAAFVRARLPIKTYSAACQLLAYAALDEEQDNERMMQIAQLLIEWQSPGGGYGYPGGAGDLSNTQYAALGLYTAARHGARIPVDTWVGLQKFTKACSREGKSAYDPTGFSYRPGGNPTASMTAAGVAIAAICEEQGGRKTALSGPMKNRGLAWLTKFFSVTSNASEEGRPSGSHLHYYLYGLERVGALCDIKTLGQFDWYREGARQLASMQKGGGEWGGNPQSCFALLFLAKATKSLTGGGGSGRSITSGNRLYGEDDPNKDVNLRAAGDSPLSIWLSSFGAAAIEDCQWDEDGDRGLRIKEVKYLYWTDENDEPRTLKACPGDPTQPHGDNRFPAQHRFERSGEWWLMAEVTLILPEGEGEGAELVLESEPMKIEVATVLDPKLLEFASDASRNLLNRGAHTVTASSELNKGWPAAGAVDDRLAGGWLSADADARPKVTISLARPTRGNVILLTPAAPGDRSTRPKKVKISVNGKISEEIELVLRDDRKTEWTIPKNAMIRRIEVEILERHAVQENKKGVGFAEIELQKRR